MEGRRQQDWMFGPRCLIMDAARNQISDLIVDDCCILLSLWEQLKILANQLHTTFMIHDCRYVWPWLNCFVALAAIMFNLRSVCKLTVHPRPGEAWSIALANFLLCWRFEEVLLKCIEIYSKSIFWAPNASMTFRISRQHGLLVLAFCCGVACSSCSMDRGTCSTSM